MEADGRGSRAAASVPGGTDHHCWDDRVFTLVDGVSKAGAGGLALTTSGTSQTPHRRRTGSLTASFTYNATGQGTINHSYTLLHTQLGVPNTSFAGCSHLQKDSATARGGSSPGSSHQNDGPVAHAPTGARRREKWATCSAAWHCRWDANADIRRRRWRDGRSVGGRVDSGSAWPTARQSPAVSAR